jgi:tRNA-binding protein
MPTIDDFEELALRIGTVARAELHPTSREPAIKLWIDFGPLGERQSSAKVTDHYEPSDLVGRQIVAVTGFPAMRVGGFRSDVLVLGALTDDGVVLLNVDAAVPPGSAVE